ncbi:MAG: hypothetical protein IH984_17465 [Planctomycetes bacterium]|nr:hypothetical protein [Planctomycetota bacterium]
MSLNSSSIYAPSRRGAALLVVLAALILVMTSSVSLVNIASTNKIHRQLDQSAKQADDLLTASNDAILSWLSNEADQVVLPPDLLEPRVDVLHDAWTINDTNYELRITAWDQCGMVPIELAQAGSPMRLALSRNVIAAIDKLKIKRNQQRGLDQFTFEYSGGEKLRVYPLPSKSQPLGFIDPLDASDAEGGLSQLRYQDQYIPTAIGSVIATHSNNTINLNTAPLKVIEQALRSAGRGGLEVVLAARNEGRAANLGELQVNQSSKPRTIRLANSSNAWSFRIDIRVDSLNRSWWAIYTKTKSTWECVQRLAITE